MNPLYIDKAHRDAAWRAAGCPGRRCSIRNQRIHPQYVADYPDAAVQADKGIGNCQYKSAFAALYSWD